MLSLLVYVNYPTAAIIVVLRCESYRDIRSTHILPPLDRFPGRSGNFYMNHLFQDSNPATVHAVAKFCAAATK